MATVLDLLAQKGMQVFTAEPGASVRDAAASMNRHGIGALVVVRRGRVEGVFTERDVLRRVVAEGRDPAATPLQAVMTRGVVTVHPEDTIDHAREVFMSRRIRHLPVLDGDDRLLGLISIGDVNAWTLDGQALEIRYLQDYLAGPMG